MENHQKTRFSQANDWPSIPQTETIPTPSSPLPCNETESWDTRVSSRRKLLQLRARRRRLETLRIRLKSCTLDSFRFFSETRSRIQEVGSTRRRRKTRLRSVCEASNSLFFRRLPRTDPLLLLLLRLLSIFSDHQCWFVFWVSRLSVLGAAKMASLY